MLWRDVIQLVSVTHTTNSIGDAIPQESTRQVYANRRSIRQSEFYQAMTTGLRPELMFEVRSAEYQGEPTVRFEGADYSIIRTYDRGEITELICTGLVNG